MRRARIAGAVVVGLTLLGAGAPSPLELYRDREHKDRVLFFAGQGGERYTDTKACREEKCAAVVTVEKNRHSKERPEKLKAGGANPASVLCGKLGGKAGTFYRLAGDEVAVCAFSDGSAVDAWDLFRARYGDR